MRKKVLIINNSARISGAETSLLTFLHHCHPEKYAVTLLVPPGAELARMAPHCTIKTWNLRRIQKSGNVLRLLAQLAGVAWSTVRLSFFVRREKVDVIYANSNQSQLYACLLNVLVRRKSIWHVRDNPGHAGLARLFAWGSSCIICISRHVYDQVPASRTVKHLVYNAVDADAWRPAAAGPALPGALGVDPDPLLVGLVGQLIPWKRSHDLVEVAAQVVRAHPRVHFVVIGEDLFGKNGPYTAHLKKAIRDRQMERHFTLTGFRENVIDYVRRLDVLVHLAHDEPFGRVLIEAMALEKPVVAIRGGGAPEIINDGRTGFLVDRGDLPGFAARLVTLLKDQRLRTRFGKNGRRDVLERFSVREHVKKIEEIIDTL